MAGQSNPTKHTNEPHNASQAASNVADRAKEMASNLGDKAKEATSTVANKAEGAASYVGHKAEDAASYVSGKADDATAAVGGGCSLGSTLRQKAPRGHDGRRLFGGGQHPRTHRPTPPGGGFPGHRRRYDKRDSP